MNRNRLLKLRSLVVELAARHVSEGADGPNGFLMQTWGKSNTCGTVACLGGWASTDPALRAEGLRNMNDQGYENDLTPAYRDLYRYGALLDFFGLTLEQTDHIFNGYNTNSFRDALARINLVLAGGLPEQLEAQFKAQLKARDEENEARERLT